MLYNLRLLWLFVAGIISIGSSFLWFWWPDLCSLYSLAITCQSVQTTPNRIRSIDSNNLSRTENATSFGRCAQSASPDMFFLQLQYIWGDSFGCWRPWCKAFYRVTLRCLCCIKNPNNNRVCWLCYIKSRKKENWIVISVGFLKSGGDYIGFQNCIGQRWMGFLICCWVIG